jgi:hypothetical protein
MLARSWTIALDCPSSRQPVGAGRPAFARSLPISSGREGVLDGMDRGVSAIAMESSYAAIDRRAVLHATHLLLCGTTKGFLDKCAGE